MKMTVSASSMIHSSSARQAPEKSELISFSSAIVLFRKKIFERTMIAYHCGASSALSPASFKLSATSGQMLLSARKPDLLLSPTLLQMTPFSRREKGFVHDRRSSREQRDDFVSDQKPRLPLNCEHWKDHHVANCRPYPCQSRRHAGSMSGEYTDRYHIFGSKTMTQLTCRSLVSNNDRRTITC